MAALLITEDRSISGAIGFLLQYFLLRQKFSIDIAYLFQNSLGTLIIGQGFSDHILVFEGDVNHDRTSARHADRKIITFVPFLFDTMAIGFATSPVSLDKRSPQHIGAKTLELLDKSIALLL